MQELQIPKLQNWWLGDGSYHLNPPIEPQEFKLVNTPDNLDYQQPFVTIDKPRPIYVSKELSTELYGLVKNQQVFEQLFAEKNEAPDERNAINSEITTKATDGTRYDPNYSFSAPDTDESFDVTQEIGKPQLVDEIETHLNYLKDRLGRIGRFSETNIREENEQLKLRPKREIVYHKYPKASVYSTTQTVDYIDLVNAKCIQEIEAREFVSYYQQENQRKAHLQHKVTERQCGGCNTSYIKRNLAPFRKAGKLKDRSIPREIQRKVLDNGMQLEVVSYGENENKAIQPFQYVKGLHPIDSQMNRFEVVNLQKQDDILTVMPAPAPTAARRGEEMRFVHYKSVDDERREITELKLNSKDENSVLEATAKILAYLKTDEQHLAGLLTDYQDEQTRPAVEGWYERRDATFAKEHHYANLRTQMQELLKEMQGGDAAEAVEDFGC